MGGRRQARSVVQLLPVLWQFLAWPQDMKGVGPGVASTAPWISLPQLTKLAAGHGNPGLLLDRQL